MFVSVSVQPCRVCNSSLALFTPPLTASGLLTNQEGEDWSRIDACAKDIPVYPSRGRARCTASAVRGAERHPGENAHIILSGKKIGMLFKQQRGFY